MKRNSVVVALLAAMLTLTACTGPQVQTVGEEKPDFSQASAVAKLSTVECTYHNVAEFLDDGTQYLAGLNVGYKKAWLEYDGTVTLGIDVTKVNVADPDDNNVVVVTVPQAYVQDCTVIKESFSPIYVDKGLTSRLTAEDQASAVQKAQEQMAKSAQENETLLSQARSRAGILLKSYVENAGKVIGKTYTVRFVDEDGSSLRIVDGDLTQVSGLDQRSSADEGAAQQEADPGQEDSGAE